MTDAGRSAQATTAPTPNELGAYAVTVRALLAHGGFERTGDAAAAARWDIAHIERWLDAHGRLDRRHAVHVAGSKGKGSVSAMVEAILRAHGARTAMLTSPDLHSPRERIAIDGAPLSYPAFTRIGQALLADPDTATWSYFELLTVMGWVAAEEAGCDWQVVEVGLGGRLDTTNAMAEKQVAVITPIDLEHTAILGETIPAIAREKAGIITGPMAVVTSPMRASALDVIRLRAIEVGSTVHEVARECAMRVERMSLEGQRLDLRTPLATYRRLESPLVGAHQSENIAAAVRAAELALEATGAVLEEHAVLEGVRQARPPGRFEVVRRRPLTILDGLHTPLAAKRFREALRAVGAPRRVVWIFGFLDGKAVDAILDELVTEGDEAFVVPAPTPRSADPARVARALRERGVIAQRAPEVPAALERATALAGDAGAVVVAGSLYTVAAAREHLLALTTDHTLGLR